MKSSMIFIGDIQIWVTDEGLRHREDGPAIIHADGSEIWWVNGVKHREDGPAVVCPDGRKEWFINDKRHRADGPALIYPYRHGVDYVQEWFINNRRVTKQVNNWMQNHNVTWPWDKNTQIQFLLTFV